jgi:hypothetical protein
MPAALQRRIETTDRQIDALVYELRPEEGADRRGDRGGGGGRRMSAAPSSASAGRHGEVLIGIMNTLRDFQILRESLWL